MKAEIVRRLLGLPSQGHNKEPSRGEHGDPEDFLKTMSQIEEKTDA
jgi:hypothetical protein